MIPIGTRCILVSAVNDEWLPHVGKTMRVVGHYIGSDEHQRHIVVFEDGTELLGRHGTPKILHSGPPDIIPIGHDPDTETRTTDREVTA